ncbi:DUF433 domain-containing protein [Microbacterium sp.]|uniref:DUF433 domain-containing protein n=1 Tax=Microbacterium sp. TaxID=51671 RepID=UPI0039C95DBA
MIVDPTRNSGQPTVQRLGVRVEDVVSRVRAGEAMDDVAEDFDLARSELRSIAVVVPRSFAGHFSPGEGVQSGKVRRVAAAASGCVVVHPFRAPCLPPYEAPDREN